MRLPLTMAIIDGMVVKVGSERYIVPTAGVRESLRLEQGSYFTVAARGEMANIRGSLIPLVRLHDLFNVEPARPDPYEGLVVVLEHEGRRRCLLVDELLGKQELVIKSLGQALRQIKGVAGGAILGDGRVGLILDVGGLFEMTEKAGRGYHIPPPNPSAAAPEAAGVELF
jgi:two-component system chemotaxis sensor kinase CheA